MYTVFIEKRVLKDLDYLPIPDVERIKDIIIALKHEPRAQHTQKLRGYSIRYRIRQGKYRIVYEIDEKNKSVNILLIGHRKDIYRTK
ncbi:MAG: type II toxin-antitoxin system RelE/ParE family toxin [Candidatus Omnitrophica bacterium]|nr:type II toxin-antitoxin system RelE/ParE family toxin [Candidatus Omnitrophota bacterium]